MLNYRLYGRLGTEPPLLVLHGLLGSLDNWHTFARSQENKRTVLAIDLRNHGGSPHVEGMSYREMVSDIMDLLDMLHISHCDLMGHSMGGKAAMSLALKHPGTLQRLVIVDIAPKTYPPRLQALLQAMLALPLAELKNRKQADEWLSPVIQHPFERGFLLKNLARSAEGRFYWECNLAEIARHYLKISGFAETGQRFDAPTLFIRGGQSEYVQDDDLLLIQQHFPAARLLTLPQAGHLPHVQTPVEFIQAVETFLNG